MDYEKAAEKILKKLVGEVQKGIFSEAKLDLLFTNPDEFFYEYLQHMREEEAIGIRNIIKQTIVTGFFKTIHQKGMHEKAIEDRE